MSLKRTIHSLCSRKAAAVAAAPLLLSEVDLNASILYFDTPLQSMKVNDMWSFNFTGTTTGGTEMVSAVAELNSYSITQLSFNYIHFVNLGMHVAGGNKTANIQSLSAGQLIDSQLAFANSTAPDYALFPVDDTTPNLYAFTIEGLEGRYYGWAEMSTESIVDNSSQIDTGTLTIHRWAVETQAGVGIEAGAVPEAADFALGLGALAVGAACVQRKRRKEAAA